MRTVADLALGVAGVLVLDATEGRPTSVVSVTVHRWSQSDASVELELEGVIEAVTTTTDAAAGRSQNNPKRVPVTSTTGFIAGGSYLLTGADQVRELVEVQDVDAGDAVIARHPLHNDYAAGAAFVSTRITAAVPLEWCSDESNLDASAGPNPMLRVRWVYVVAGKTRVTDTYFNLVRYPGHHGVTPAKMETLHAGWLDRLPIAQKVDQGASFLEEAYRSVKIDMHQVNVDDSSVAEAELVDELVRYKAIELAEFSRFLAAPDVDETRLQAAERRYTARLDALIRVTAKLPTRDESGAAAARNPLPLSRR